MAERLAGLDFVKGKTGDAVKPALAEGFCEWASAFSNTGLSPALAWLIAFECNLLINGFIACVCSAFEYWFIAFAR